jgi:probable F420-dependent oxidoreductase
MRFSCALPVDDIGEEGFLSIDAIGEMVRAIDRAGLDACFVTDHPAPSRRWLDHGGHATLDPFVVLTVAATASARIRVHTHILVLAYRNPFVVAKAAASLDALSGGRLVMGIGTGYLRPEYAAVGVPFEERGARTDEALAILRQAWTGEPVAYQGRHFEARDAVVLPKPANPAGIPIWAGGNSERAIRRAVEHCEGWCPFPVTGMVSATARTDELANIAQLRDKLAHAHDLAASIGRSRPLEICMGRFDHDVAMKPDGRPDAARAIDDYAELAEAGVGWTTMSVPSPSRSAFIENVLWFGEEVAAKVNAGSRQGSAGGSD